MRRRPREPPADEVAPGPFVMRNRLEAYKPAAPARVHLLLAALLWTVVGGLLAFFGGRWVLAGEVPYGPALLGAAVGVGLLKARYVLVRTARRTIDRIRERGDGRCIGGFLSVRTWALVALMSTAGRVLRGGILPRSLVGWVYVAVGTALLVAGLRLWQAWYGHDGKV